MKLNNDDTKTEEYVADMHRETDVLINCTKCSRLFYTDYKLASDKYLANPHAAFLCVRCKNNKELSG